LVRAGEIAISLDLLQALPPPADAAVSEGPADVSGSGQAVVETPRGAARLHVVLDRGVVVAAHLETPTDRNVALVPAATLHEEVADALVAVASLDLSPWERDR
ncbi:MAG TPA: hypothetical protein VFU81_10045, partial [Thermomicrobiales bacterium]|nr:hypothetical protein [Thermomicrobiales bacterium]